MAELGHYFQEMTVKDSKTGDTWYTYFTVDSSNFTPGKKYLLWVVDKGAGSSTNSNRALHRMCHGSGPTPFTESLREFRPNNSDYVWFFFTEWTAVSGEDVILQLRSNAGATGVYSDQTCFVAIDLDGLQPGDYYYDEDSTDADLSTTPVDGAEITFTPANNNDDWLVASVAALTPDDDIATPIGTQIKHGADTDPRAQQDPNSLSNRHIIGLVRPYTLSNTSHTFTEQSYYGSSNNSRVFSAIFALRLNAFKDHVIYWNVADIGDPLSTTDYATEVASASITPSQTGDVFILSSCMWGKDNSGNVWMKYRQQVYENGQSEVDQPPTQTADAYDENDMWDDLEEAPCQVMTVESLTASTQYDIDLDASEEGDTTHCEDRAIVAFTFELAEEAPAEEEFLKVIIRPHTEAP